MQKKIFVTFVTLLMCLNALIIVTSNNIVEASIGGGDSLDLQLTHKVSENLSNVIKVVYDVGELHKGRAFGSKGEHNASDYIYDVMDDLGLDPKKEQIIQYPNEEVDDKIDVIKKGVKIYGTNSIDCHIRPRWNDSFVYRNVSGMLSLDFNKSMLTPVFRTF